MNRLLKNATVSWKTTTAGVIGFLVVALQAAQMLLDGDATTNPDWNLVAVAFMAMVTAITAKDGDKSTEDHK